MQVASAAFIETRDEVLLEVDEDGKDIVVTVEEVVIENDTQNQNQGLHKGSLGVHVLPDGAEASTTGSSLPVGVQLDGLEGLQLEAVTRLLQKHSDVFSSGNFNLGDCSVIPHEIKVSDGPPIRLPYRRIPPHLMPEVQSMLQEMLKQGIIRHSKSSFASLIVVVKKKDGSLRLCVDYKQLNDQTVKDSFPLPRIEEALEALSGATSSLWIQPMDIFRSECIQIRRGRQRFVYPGGLYEFLGCIQIRRGRQRFVYPGGCMNSSGCIQIRWGRQCFVYPGGCMNSSGCHKASERVQVLSNRQWSLYSGI